MKKFSVILFVLAAIGSFFFAPAAVVSASIMPANLQDFANDNFSSFEGESYYTGEGDQWLDFGGPNTSFATEHSAGRVFLVNIKNDLNTTENVILFPGYTWYPGATGNNWLIDGAIKTVDTKTLSATGSPKTIKELLSFIMKNPTNLNAIRISSSDATQVQQQMVYKELSPFKDLQSRIIDLGTFTNENTYRDKIVTVPTPGIIASNEVELSIPIIAGSTCSITFFFGGVLSASVAMKNKRSQAASTFAKVGIGNVQRLHAVKQAMPGLPATQSLLRSNFDGEDDE